MSLIVVKLPKKYKKVSILQSEDEVRKEIQRRQRRLEETKRQFKEAQQPEVEEIQTEELPEPEEEIAEQPEEIIPPKPKKTVFTEEFTITDSNQPIEISFSNIPEETLPLAEAMNQIQQAYDRGLADGQDTAKATVQMEVQKHYEMVRNIDSIIDELKHQHTAALAQLEETLIPLSISIAKHIIECEVFEDKNIVVEQVRKAMKPLDDDKIFKIRVNPKVSQFLKDATSRIFTDEEMIRTVEIMPDSTIDIGGCILETSAGIVDARINTQLAIVRHALEDAAVEAKTESEISFSNVEAGEIP